MRLKLFVAPLAAMSIAGLPGHADAQPAPPAPVKVEFKKHMGYEQFGPAGPYEPDRAARNGVSGAAIIQCKVASDRRLKDCLIVSETPRDTGFGPASRAMANAGVIRAPENFQPAPSDTPVLFEVPFLLPHGDAREQKYFEAKDLTDTGHFGEAIGLLTSVIKDRPE